MKKTLIILAGLVALAASPLWAVDAIIKSGSDFSTPLTIDSTAKAARFTEYAPDGTVLKPSARYSYAASSAAVTFQMAASATDVCSITGSATKTVKVANVVFIASQTTAGNVNVILVKRSSANTGVVFSTPTVFPLDSASPAGTAVVRIHTANPTTGTPVGYVGVNRILIPAAATAVSPDAFNSSYGLLSQPVVLRGTSEVLAVNLNGQTVTGGSFGCGFIWTEE